MSATTYIVKPVICETPLKKALSPQPTFMEYVREDLEAVENVMHGELKSDVRLIYDLSNHLLRAGGKRLRPAMVALAARAVNPDMSRERIGRVGAAVELVHMATLVHDDVVDNTATRRGKPTANAIFGNGAAVLSGDYILARALQLLTADGDLRIIRNAVELTSLMVEGEVMEIGVTGNAYLPTDQYMEILRKKTAVFVEGCCKCGAILGGADEKTEAILGDYGYRLGMAFQLADDLLDYIGDPKITGKPRGSDLRDGRPTLPFLIAMRECNMQEKSELMRAFGNYDLTDEGVLEINVILSRYDAFDRTREAARQHVEKSEIAINCLPPSKSKECFQELTDFVIQRDR